MASPRVCSIPGCGKRHKGRGLCMNHYALFRRHGDPLIRKPPKRWDRSAVRRQYKLDPEWLREQYSVKGRRVGHLAAELGCSREVVQRRLREIGIATKDERAGCVRLSRRVVFDVNEARRLYLEEKMSCPNIGVMLGVSGTAIGRKLKAIGVVMRHHNDTKRGRKPHNAISLPVADVVNLYREEYASALSVSRKYSVGPEVIRRILREANEPRKEIAAARDIRREKHPRWRSDLTPDERETRRDLYLQKVWRKKIYARDEYICQKCGDDRGHNLNAHHIEPHCRDRSLRWDLSNGVTLCVKCHRKFHRTYGLIKCTRADLIEYLGQQIVRRNAERAKGIAA